MMEDKNEIPEMKGFQKKEYAVYVHDIPVELAKDAIEDIFGQYGEVTSLFHYSNTKWAYVMYGTYGEAERAIRHLNNKKPLYLKVTLSEDRSFEKVQVQSRAPNLAIEQASNIVDARYLPVTNVKPRRPVLKLNEVSCTVQKYCMSRRPGNRSLPFLEGYNMYETDEPYVNTNRLWSRDVMSHPFNRKRQVSYGRGHIAYEVPEQDPQIEEYIKRVHTQRFGIYKHLDDKLCGSVKRCSVCLTKTMKHCEKCDTYYCSRACQASDWPLHQIECGRIPALVDEAINDTSPLKIKLETNMEEKHVNQAQETSAGDMTLRRLPSSMQAESSNSTNTSMSKNGANVTNDSTTTNQHGYLPARYENSSEKPRIQGLDRSSTNTISDKYSERYRETAESNQSQTFDQVNKHTDQPNRSIRHSSASNDNYRNGQDYVNDTDKTSNSSSNRYNSNTNTRDRSCNKTPPHQKNESQNISKPAFYKENNVNKQMSSACSSNDVSSNNWTFQKDTYLSKTRFTDIKIMLPLNNGEYWIHKMEDTDAHMRLMTKLQDVAEKSRSVQPIVGNIYGVLYETSWHRAIVMSLNPMKLHYIDCGNDETLKYAVDIKDIQDLARPPQFARKIRLTACEKYKNLKYGDKISVKMISMNADKIITVEVQEQASGKSVCAQENAMPSHTVRKSSANERTGIAYKGDSKVQLPHIFNALDNLLLERGVSELKIMGLLQICDSVQNNIYGVTLCPFLFNNKFETLLDNLQVECEKIESESMGYKPQLGDFVCGKMQDEWHRGYIQANPMILNELRIVSIDKSSILSVDKIVPCPDKLLDGFSFGVTCEVNQSIELKMGETYNFTTILKEHNLKQEALKIDITAAKDSESSAVINAVIKPWKPLPLKLQTPAFKLKNGSKICLTNYRNQCLMFGRSLDEESIEHYNRVMQRVAQAAQTAPYLSEPETIKKSQMVIAPYIDGNHYRAIMTAVKGDMATITYVDFGNISDVKINELQILPESLKMQRSCATKIYLKDVPRDVPMTKEVDIYLRCLIAQEDPLTCTYDESPENGVYLTFRTTEESVNEKINQLLEFNWKRKDYDDKQTCHMVGDMKIASLGDAGTTVDALVLFLQEDKKYVMLAPTDIDLVTHITDVMPPQIKEYCENTAHYIPRQQELCLALYEEAWYRAFCVNPEVARGLAEIFFMDYGNMENVEQKNIRLMPDDFIEPAAMACMCTIVNLPPMNADGKYPLAVERMLEGLKPMESIVKVKIVKCVESGVYEIELPEIRAALIKQDLTPS